MASTYAKRLQRLEEQMASGLNQPLAYVWVEAGETREEAIVRAGYDLSQADRIKTIRWMTRAESASAPPKPWDLLHGAGPLPDEGPSAASMLAPEPRSEGDPFAKRESEMTTERIEEGYKKFAKSFV
jgi:hypothetical protein